MQESECQWLEVCILSSVPVLCWSELVWRSRSSDLLKPVKFAEHKSLFGLSTPAMHILICIYLYAYTYAYKYVWMIHHWLFWFSGHPTQWQGLEDWPEANGENTSTLHPARSWESFQCSAWAPQVPRVAQPASGYLWLHD